MLGEGLLLIHLVKQPYKPANGGLVFFRGVEDVAPLQANARQKAFFVKKKAKIVLVFTPVVCYNEGKKYGGTTQCKTLPFII
jgi:hypothetical protein